MHYEINVSKEGQHVFCTAPHSCTSLVDLARLYSLIREKFPESEGYSLMVRRCVRSSTSIEGAELTLVIDKYGESKP